MNELMAHRLCDAENIEPGGIGSASLPDGRRVAIYNVDGTLYATDDLCTHGHASLSDDGTLEGCIIECGLHLGAFDVRTGAPVATPCTKALQTYPIQIRDGAVWLDVPATSQASRAGT